MPISAARAATSWSIAHHDMLSDAAPYVELRSSHFIGMEQPERVHQLLLDFLSRVV